MTILYAGFDRMVRYYMPDFTTILERTIGRIKGKNETKPTRATKATKTRTIDVLIITAETHHAPRPLSSHEKTYHLSWLVFRVSY